MLGSTLEEKGFLGVIDEVVEQMAAGEKLVRDVGTGIHTREHAHRTAVDNDLIMLHELRCEVGVNEPVWRWRAADIGPFDAQPLQSHSNGAAGTTCSQDECMLVPGLQKRPDAVHETDDIAIETLQATVPHTYHIDRPYLLRLIAQLVEHGDDSLLVRQGDIESAQVGIGLHDAGKHIGRGYLKVDILGINVLALEFLCKESTTETVSQRVANDSIFVHNLSPYVLFSLFFYYLLPFLCSPQQVSEGQTVHHPFTWWPDTWC